MCFGQHTNLRISDGSFSAISTTRFARTTFFYCSTTTSSHTFFVTRYAQIFCKMKPFICSAIFLFTKCCWHFGQFQKLAGYPDILSTCFFRFDLEVGVNFECTSWKMAFALLRQKTALITLCLPSTTSRGPCSYLLLKMRSTTFTNQRYETQYNQVKRRIIFCFSRTWQEGIQHWKRHSTHRNELRTEALHSTCGK